MKSSTDQLLIEKFDMGLLLEGQVLIMVAIFEQNMSPLKSKRENSPDPSYIGKRRGLTTLASSTKWF